MSNESFEVIRHERIHVSIHMRAEYHRTPELMLLALAQGFPGPGWRKTAGIDHLDRGVGNSLTRTFNESGQVLKGRIQTNLMVMG